MWGDHSGRVAHRPTRQPKTKLLPPTGGSGTARRSQAALKVLHLVIRNPIANRLDGTGRPTGWKAALNVVTLFYGDRIRGLVGDRRGEGGVVGWQVGVEGENAAAEADRFVAADIACDQDAAREPAELLPNKACACRELCHHFRAARSRPAISTSLCRREPA